MSDGAPEKLPQNINHLLMEIGEKQVLFRLCLAVHDSSKKSSWEVYPNLAESGYDIVLLNMDTKEKLRIEVKARQRLSATAKKESLNMVHFTLTKTEYQNCDFLIAYWLENNDFFIVPKSEFKQTSSKGNALYKFVVRKNKSQKYNPEAEKYLNKWETITALLNS